MRKAALIACLLFLLPFGVAQSLIGQQEDFENDTLAVNPTDSWYTYTDAYTDTGCDGDSFPPATCRSQVVTPGLDGTDQMFVIIDGDPSGASNARFTITEAERFTNTTFYLRQIDANPDAVTITFEDSNGVNIVDWLHRAASNGFLSVIGFSGVGGSELVDDNVHGWEDDATVFYELEFDWVANTYNVSATRVSTGQVLTFSNRNFEAAATNLGGLRFDATEVRMQFDQWRLDGGPLTVTTPEPTEFDSGLLSFINGIGFITPASQFFFSIILVGIATVAGGVVLKFMAPSRMKLIIVLSVAALVGAFCAILQLYDLWMYLLAIVIAGTIVKGATEFRSTWRELRETIANRSRVVNQDGETVTSPPATPSVDNEAS